MVRGTHIFYSTISSLLPVHNLIKQDYIYLIGDPPGSAGEKSRSLSDRRSSNYSPNPR